MYFHQHFDTNTFIPRCANHRLQNTYNHQYLNDFIISYRHLIIPTQFIHRYSNNTRKNAYNHQSYNHSIIPQHTRQNEYNYQSSHHSIISRVRIQLNTFTCLQFEYHDSYRSEFQHRRTS